METSKCFFREISALQKKLYALRWLKKAISPKITFLENKEIIDRFNLEKFFDLIRIGSSIEKMHKNFSGENFILKKKSFMHL